MSYLSELDNCKSVDELLSFCMERVTNLKLRTILIRAARGIKEDPIVSLSEEASLFKEAVARWVLSLEKDSFLMNDSELEEHDINLSRSLDAQRERYVLLREVYGFDMTVDGGLLSV